MSDSSLQLEDLLARLSRGWQAYALIALVTLAAGACGLFTVPPLDRDESRYAQATTQMLERSDFVRIAVQDVPRNKKPIGIHWLQSASVALTVGPEARAIWAYRLPSLAGAILAALACFWGGTALVGRRAAFVGSALLGCCILLSTEAMIAKTDAALCGFTTLAMAALARVRAAYSLSDKNPEAQRLGLKNLTSTTDPASGAALLFWGAFAGGVLIKGPVTPIVAGFALAMLFFWEGRARWMKPLTHFSGPLIAALIVVPWFVAIGVETNGRFFAEAVGGDLGRKVVSGDEGHSGLPGYHLALLPLLSFPIAVGLPAAVRLIWDAIRGPRSGETHSAARFLTAWAVPTLLVFEFLPTKLVHYPLPAYPALALLAGAGLVMTAEQNWRILRWAAAAMFLIAAAFWVAAVGAGALLPGFAMSGRIGDVTAALPVAAPVAIAALALLVWFCIARAPGARAFSAIAAALLIVFTARQVLLPQAHAMFVSQGASDALWAAGVHPRQKPNSPRLISVGYDEPSFVFLTRTDTLLARGNDAPRAARPGQVLIVESRERTTLEESLAVRGWQFAPIGPPVRGLNYSNGEPVVLQPGRVVAVSVSEETEPEPAP